MAEAPPDVALARAAIDEVDHALIELCARRRSIVLALFARKRELGLPLIDPAREADLIDDRRAFAARIGVPADLVERIFRALLDDSHAEISPPNAGSK